MANANVQQMVIPMPADMDPAYHNELQRLFEQLYYEAFWVTNTVTADHTTESTQSTPIRKEHVIVSGTGTSTITISIHDGSDSNYPREADEVLVTRNGSVPVTADFGNLTCNGASTVVLTSQYASPHFKFASEIDEWVIV